MRSADKYSIINELRQKLRCLENGDAAPALLPLGVCAIDAALSGGLPLGCLHEVIGAEEDAAAAGFCAVLLGRLSAGRPVLWCEAAGGRDGALYAPGLPAFGLDPARLVRLLARRDSEILWAMEEGLRSGALAAVLGAVDAVPRAAGRRLQLAAEAGGSIGLLLRRPGTREASGALAVTRWRVVAAPAHPQSRQGYRDAQEAESGWPDLLGHSASPREPNGDPTARLVWHVSLLRCRLGRPQDWLMEWNHATRDFAVAAALRDGSPAPAAGG